MPKTIPAPLILISNDDGIRAPGLKCLVETLKNLGELVVVAPDQPQSGMGHAITISKPLRVETLKKKNGCKWHSCSGTPADCIKLGTKIILKKLPDLVVSGINHGSNSSTNALYSGTLSAAMEGAIEGIPAIGFSYCDSSWEANLDICKEIVKSITRNVLKKGLPGGTLLNVNIPKGNEKPLKGIKICRQANARWIEEFEERVDPSGRNYYWLKGNFKNFDKGQDTDEWALGHNYVSVVPLQYDLTAHHVISVINGWEW